MKIDRRSFLTTAHKTYCDNKWYKKFTANFSTRKYEVRNFDFRDWSVRTIATVLKITSFNK